MDSYQNFVEIFQQAALTRDFDTLTNILKDIQKSHIIISTEHRESVVRSIFDKRNGLLCFLEYELNRRIKDKYLDNALTEGYIFLKFFIQQFYRTTCFVQYIHQIKDVCHLALTIKCSHYTQKYACNAFITLIELFRNHDLKLDETINKFIMAFHVNNIKERRLIFCVLSKIIKHDGSACLSEKYSNIIFRQLYSDASQEYNPDTAIRNDFHMYFDVLADILDSIEPSNKIKKKLFCDLYKWIKDINRIDRQQNIRVLMRSAIDLFSRHVNLFRDLLYPDCKYWHNVLRCLSHNTTISGACGQRALKSFYRVIGQILTEQNNKESKSILSYFVEDFQKEFENSNLDLITLRLTVYGFSQMAAPCRTNLCEFIVEQMYSTITSCALPLCFNEQSDSAHIENVCYYQEALSEIFYNVSDITIEKINVLVKLSIYIIKRFPDLVISNADNATAISTLIKTISNLGIINKNILQRYLDNIIYDGIAWSCSHTLALDAELQRELNNLQQTPVCYKNYLPLWKELLKVQKYRIDDRERVVQHVADVLMNVCIMLISRLDIRLKQTNEDTVLSDVALTQSAVNQADFRIFANIVDLYVDIINASEPSLFFNTMHKFLYEIVRLSFKYPLISGFYKLVRAGMKSFITHMSEEEEKNAELRQTEELLSNYLIHTLDLISTFSNELLIACLYLILEAPLIYIEDTLLRTLPAFKIAFTIGLSNLELAYTALAALETWTTTQKQEQNERTNELLCEIVAYLEPYLRSTESSVEIPQDLTKMRKRMKRVDVIDTECTLRNFQRRVLLFFGSLNQNILSSFVHERASRSTGASWDRKDLLKYSLPLPDARPDIYFDRMLPRIIALARDSSDRRTKIAACEVLHSMVTLVVGSTARHLSDPENPFTLLYGVLCPAVLALGCDTDEVVCGLFQPFALQLMRLLSSRLTLTSSVIPQLLDSLFNGLTVDSNPSLRDFSGMCLAEFTYWSIRQSSDMQEIQPNVHEIIQRINNFALHPSMRKRVAAAVAFNHLYIILREEDDIVSIYWLEIFYCFVRSLDGCDDPSITNALTHIEKVMKSKADLLNAHRNRRKPHEFDEATLNHALYWLLSQCGVLDECCRAKCMELYVNISQHVNHSAQETMQTFVETYGMNQLNDIILRGLESCVEDISVTGNVMALLKALDYYMWLIEKELLPVEELFPANNAENHLIFSCIRSFAYQFWRVNTEPLAETITTATKYREFDKLQTIQCKVLMTMLNFIQVLLNVDVNVLPESLWNESLSALMIKCVMHPRAVGFDIKNIEMMDRLPHVLEILLNSIKSRFGNSLPDTFKKCLSSSCQKHIEKLLHLNDITQNGSCDKLIQHVNGLILLGRCDMLDWTIWSGGMSAFAKGEDTIMQIFNFLVSERIGELTCNDLSAQMIEYLQGLMKFQLSQISLTIETPERLIPDDTRSMTETLIRLISDDTPVIGLNSAKITHGEHFLNTFRSVIFRYMLTHVSVITLVFDMSSDNPSFLLKWIEDLLLFLKLHRRELQTHVDPMVDTILKHFEHLENIAGNVNSRKERLMNIYSIAVHFKSKPAEIKSMFREFYQRILDKLTDNGDLEYKTQILRNFLVCLIDGTDRGTDELRVILRNLRNDSRFLCPNLLTETGANAMKIMNCFETLLVLLSSTRSIMMLECVIHFAAGAGERLFDEKLREHLRIYYHGASNEHVLRSLKVTYHAFMNVNITDTERLDILRGFLLPTFEFCNATAIERFFKQNIRELYTIINQCIANYDYTVDKQTIVSKIGCFQLITIMLTTVDINNKDNEIVLDQINPDSGLFKNLFDSAKKTRAVKITQSKCGELARQLHCAAYNCSLAIVSLKKEERFYSAAFGENRKDDLLIWENIVDCNKHYKLGQTFQDYPKIREITVNIRSTDDRYGQSTDRHAYIHTYDLSTSTLYEDINAYDLNRCILLPSNHSSQHIVAANDSIDSNPLSLHSAASIVLESDDFNEHECMPYICVLLRHIIKSFRPSDELPKWLQLFHSAMMHNHPNIKLFMLKIVSNTSDEVFKPYAKFTLMPIVKVITSYLENHSLNYIVTDVLEILIDWHDVAVLSDENDRMEIQKFFEVLVDKVVTKRPDGDCRVYNNNLSLMRTLTEKWRDCLREPNISLDEKMVSAPNATVYLILVLLDNNMAEKVVLRDDIVDFLLKPLRDWDAPETDEMSLQCCECLGLFLKFLNNANDGEVERENNRDEEREIFTVLGSFKSYQYMVKQVKRIVVLCRAYPAVAVNYINIAISAMAKNLEKSYCLEIFVLAMPKLDAESIMNSLRQMELQRVLTNRTSSCKMVLQIVRDMVAIISPTDLLSYVKLAVQYIKDNTTEHRELVYDILMNVHKRYSADIADDVAVQTLLSISVQNLLVGMVDPSHDLQERILRFWTEMTDFSTGKSKELLIALLNMHSLTAEDAFAPFVALLILQLASKSMDYTKKMFDAPLQFNCTFEDYRIAVSWRRRNLSCMTPMFVDSLASQINYSTFSESVDNDSRGNVSFYPRFSHIVPMRLRATQDFKFEPTLIDEDEVMMTNSTTTFGISSFDAEFNGTINASLSKRLPQSPTVKNKRFRRILARPSDVANIIRHKQIQKNVQWTEMIKQENVRQRSKVRLYRDYRIGDFPDIEISHSSLIVPLQQLVKLDQLICRDMTVLLLCSLIKEITEREKSNDFCDIVIEKLKWILHDSCKKNSSFNAIILETLLQLNVADCNPRDIVKVSKANGLNALGILLLERSLLLDTRDDDSLPTSSKRMRRQDDEEIDKWARLASLYKSQNDVDVVLSIFRERQFFSEDVQEAALAEVNGDWIRVRDAFEKAYEQIENPSMKEHCLQGLFEAVNNLCDWSAIDRLVKTRVNGDLNNIWNDAWKDWMMPYACDSFVHMMTEHRWKSENDDLLVIQRWMHDQDRLENLKSMVGENLVTFMLQTQQREATNLLNNLLDKIGEQWVGLSPLCTELGVRKLQKLQAINDLNASLKVLCANKADFLDKMVVLLNFWSTKAPMIRDNLIQWNKLAAYRIYSTMLFELSYDELQEDSNGDNRRRKREIRKQMRKSIFQLRLDIGNAALNQKHRYIAEKHLNFMKRCKEGIICLHLDLSLMWLEARTKCLCADIETDELKKMSNYIASWKYSHQLLNRNDEIDANMSTAVREHISVLASKIESFSRENDGFARMLADNITILQDIGIADSTSVELDDIRKQLLRYSLNNLRDCCDRHAKATAATNIGEYYCTLARYCYVRLKTTDVDSDEIFREFVLSILRSMYHDYLEATHYFPCLLRPERLRNEETRETFVKECEKLQPWLFLRWRDLLFSHLETSSIATVVVPIVKKLAETYPDAVVYTYYLAIERNPDILQDGRIQRIRSLLGNKAEEYKRFLEAIQYVVQPELYLKHYLDETMKQLFRGKLMAIESLLQKVYSVSSIQAEKNPRSGKIYEAIARYESEIRSLNPNNLNATRERIRKIKDALDRSLQKGINNVRLKAYSPFLHEYTGGDIEIPGQYVGNKEPIPRYHVKIVRFEPRVAVMHSLRKPIRIGMIGDNGREYKFLVKFGEDLTIDHGLQQLYATMNRTLSNDSSCRQRHLAIDTYEVIPLSRSFGLIQWIEDTKSLEDLVRFTLLKKETERCESIRKRYAMWIAPSKRRIADQYKEAVFKYSQREVTEKMESFIGETKRTALRDTFNTISPSPECFMTLRRNFITSYATMCAAHWLAGIGDRHLQNTLVRVATGRCLGIDFGHAFDSGICAPIPELVPFRLTPQILELLRPFTEQDLLAMIMTHVIRALRDNQGPILACMDIFIHKPVNRSLSINDDEIMQDDCENLDTDLTWSSKRNIEIVSKKLNGIHPSFITLEQLKEAHENKYLTRYDFIITGNDGSKQTRADIRNKDCLTPAEQVDCLLDQAKDLNILGRMYANWQPWL